MGDRPIELITLSVGMPKTIEWKGNEMVTGIRKQPVKEAYLCKDGFKGDGVANRKFHGGSERAVCIYPYEHYPER